MEADRARSPIFPPSACKNCRHTSLLLLESKLVPVSAHAIPQRHPQIGLLLRRHGLPSLLNVRKGRVGDSVSLASLLELRDSGAGRDPGGGRERRAEEGGCAEHCGGVVSPMGRSGVIIDRSGAFQWVAGKGLAWLAGVLKLWGGLVAGVGSSWRIGSAPPRGCLRLHFLRRTPIAETPSPLPSRWYNNVK